MTLRKTGSLLAGLAVAGSSLVLVAAPASAATCGHGTVRGNFLQGDRAFGSCTSFARSSEQVRITADCIASFDRNTSWFHDYSLHYTGWCYGPARGSFVSARG